MTIPTKNAAGKESLSLASIQGERRQITVFFSDLVDFTGISERLDEEEVYDLVRRVTSEQERVIEKHGGTVQEFAGDGLMAVFGAPVALEDAPVRACRAALEIQDVLRGLESELRSRHGVSVVLRIGINSGAAIIGRMGDSRATSSSALGDTVNVAARLQALAEPGNVVISAATHALVAPFTRTVPLGEHLIKGKAKPEAVFRLQEVRKGVARFEAAQQRGLTALVGRDAELESLLRAWQRAEAGERISVTVLGEAGIGKSRLIHEFLATIQEPNLTLLAGHCLADGGSPYGPFIEVMELLFGIEEQDGSEGVVRRLRAGLEGLGLDPSARLPFLLNLFGQKSALDGQDGDSAAAAEVVGVQTRQTLLEILQRASVRSPTILVIEDLHWIDTASLAVLRAIPDSEELKGFLVIASSRPTALPDGIARSGDTIELRPLSTEGVTNLLRARLGTKEIPSDLVRTVAEASDGNPLFAEELVIYLLQRGKIARTGEGVRLDPTFDPSDLPATLENLLLERVDHLAEGPRAVIRLASVVGRRFAASVVREVGALNGKFPEFIGTLTTEELIFPEAVTTWWSDHIFKHALVQNAIYRTILRANREEMHRRVGEIIEARYAERIDEVANTLAYHFENGHVPTKAVFYTALAGRRALKLMSLDEAERLLRRVIEIEERSPGSVGEGLFADVLIDMLHLTCWRYNFTEMLALSQRFLPQIERMGQSRYLSRVLQWTGEALVCAGRFDEARATLDRAFRMGEVIGSKECLMFALWDLLWLCAVRPDDRPVDYIEKNAHVVLGYAQELNDYYHEAAARASLAIDMLERGHVQEADQWARDSIAFGERTGYAPAISLGLTFAAVAAALKGQHELARGMCEDAVSRAASEIEKSFGLAAKGSVLLIEGRFVEARDILGDLRRIAREETFQVLLTSVEIPYGAALALSGDVAGGLAALATAREMFGNWRNSRMVAWAHLVTGMIHLHLATSAGAAASVDEAQLHFKEALRIGRQAGTDGHVAEALWGLGVLSQAAGTRDEARSNLEEARRIVTPLGWPDLAGRIDAALAALEANQSE